MGIVNVTPDSFSDGGCFLDPGKAIEQGLQLAAEGADLLDIGGESTRPGAEPVPIDEELRRVLPVIRGLVAQGAPPLSIDTRHVEVAAAALDAGACIVNVHMQGDPASMQRAPSYANVTSELLHFFAERLEQLARLGVDPAQVAIDPGIGFGKTVEHNLQLLQDLGDFTRLSRPILLGVSRKSFLGRVTGAATRDRIPAGLACTVWAAQRGTRIFRTHDVAPTVQSLQILNAIESCSRPKS
jgi:dihydropteroate synthase